MIDRYLKVRPCHLSTFSMGLLTSGPSDWFPVCSTSLSSLVVLFRSCGLKPVRIFS
jgi:hypothetical protein